MSAPSASSNIWPLIVLALIVSAIGICVMRSSALFERAVQRSCWFPVWIRPVHRRPLRWRAGDRDPAGAGCRPRRDGARPAARNMAVGFIATLIALKLFACLVSLASGFRGGFSFASLFVGSLLGKLFAAVVALIGSSASRSIPWSSMLTGMATLGVAIVGGPLTMSFLVLEMTRSVDVTAVVLAAALSPASSSASCSAIRSRPGACIFAARPSAAPTTSAGCAI